MIKDFFRTRLTNYMNYYRLLGINKNATRDEITRAYRKEIFKNHPDRNIGKENEKLSISILLNEAYEILTNDEKKKEYDKNINDVELKTNKLKKKLQYLFLSKMRLSGQYRFNEMKLFRYISL